MVDPSTSNSLRPLARGEPAPWFRTAVLSGSSEFAFDTAAGRLVLMLFFGSAAPEPVARALECVLTNRDLFDDQHACFFGVTSDRSDVEKGRIAKSLPGIRYLLDWDRSVAAAFGLVVGEDYIGQWIMLDRTLRVLKTSPLEGGEKIIGSLRAELAGPMPETWAPVLHVSNVLPEELCARLIRGYEKNGGAPSGFMRQVDGKTVLVVDNEHKQRRDWTIADERLRQEIMNCIGRNLIVPIQRAFQFTPTRIERYLVACYRARAGHFRPHRDNTTSATVHRKFAVTINLNAGEYEGGDLRFPEFSDRTYCASTGGAIVFSCSLLHEVTPVTKGQRFAFLPFLYDEDAARLREVKNVHLSS